MYEKLNNATWITLNRPEVSNTINDSMRGELIEVLEDARDDKKIRVVIITGEKAFCTGGARTFLEK